MRARNRHSKPSISSQFPQPESMHCKAIFWRISLPSWELTYYPFKEAGGTCQFPEGYSQNMLGEARWRRYNSSRNVQFPINIQPDVQPWRTSSMCWKKLNAAVKWPKELWGPAKKTNGSKLKVTEIPQTPKNYNNTWSLVQETCKFREDSGFDRLMNFCDTQRHANKH